MKVEENINTENIGGKAYATGKRKNSIARVWITRGSGRITVNKLDIEKYFSRPILRMLIKQPLVLTKRETEYDTKCTVSGGGLSGQAGAIRHGISKALNLSESELRQLLKKEGFLKRDSRICLLYTSPRPRDATLSRMTSSA